MIRSHAQLPPIVNGYPIEGPDSWFSVIVPIQRMNLCQNPSFETNTTSWSAIGGSIARSTAQQYHGAYSLAITPTSALLDGARYDTVALVSGTTYAYSAKVRGVAGLKYSLNIETNAGVSLGAAVTFTANGRWQWVYGYYTETSSTTRRLTVRKSTGNTSTGVFNIDGVQVEAISAGETASSFIDPDAPGLLVNQSPPGSYWNGTPHASTSTRTALDRSGGMVMPLSKYGFLLTAMIGLGLAVPQNMATEYARIDGGFDDYTRKPTRQFSLAGRLQARTPAQLDRLRSQLGALLDRDLVGLDQRLVLRYQKRGPDGAELSDAASIPAKYASGLDGQTDNHYAEQVALTFTQYLPVIQAEGEAGASLTVQASLATPGGILQRSPSGTWSKLGTGAAVSGAIFALRYGLDGSLYAGGGFTSIGGVANTNGLGRWDGSAWNAMGTGPTGGNVNALAVGPDGAIYAGGTFTSVGGVANTPMIAKWNGSAWSALGTGGSGGVGTGVFALAFGPDGTLYAGGTFTLMGGVANTVRIAKWNGSAWSAMGTGASLAGVAALAAGLDGTIYAAGSFTAIGGVASTNGIAKWNGSAWSSMAGGVGGADSASALAVAPDGSIYVGGSFVTIGGVSINRIAKWNGTAFTGLGTGALDQTVAALLVLPNGGGVLAGGSFTNIGGISPPDSIALWNGSSWVLADIAPTSLFSNVGALTAAPDGTLTIGFGVNAASALSAAITTVTNPGTARAYPTLIIRGPSSGTSRIYELANYTTGRSLFFNLTISAGETVTIRLTPDSLSFISTFTGSVARFILPGSNEADFFLAPGSNAIAFFAAAASVTATLQWRLAYTSLDGLTR